MAPTIEGSALGATCQNCRSFQRLAFESFNSRIPTRCFQCGGQCDVDATVLEGSRVYVAPLQDNATFRRFDLVAFWHDEQLIFKRVWGLPGETVEIRDGEFYADHHLLQKSLKELTSISISVAGGWYSNSETQLNLAPNQEAWCVTRPTVGHINELETQKWLEITSLTDDYAGNQGTSYQLQRVSDYQVCLALNPAARRQPITFSLAYRGCSIPIEILPELSRTDPSTTSEGPCWQAGRLKIPNSNSITIGLCDGQILVQIQADAANYPAAQIAWADVEGQCQAWEHGHSLLVASVEARSSFEELAFSRDIFLRTTHRTGGGSESFGKLAADAYFLLGDNQPLSIDSRHTKGAVTRGRIIGKVSLTEAVAR